MTLIDSLKPTGSTTVSNGGTTFVLKDKHAIFDSLHRRIAVFSHDAERGRTFDVWYKLHEDLFTNECNDLDEKDKTRLLLSRIDERCRQLYHSTITPRTPSEVNWDDTMKTLDQLFGSPKTMFRRRYECFKLRYDGSDINDYIARVRTDCTNAKLDNVTFDGLQCLVFVSGFQGPEYAEYRTRLLRKLDQSDNVTIKDLGEECRLIKLYKEDSKLIEADSTAVNRVDHQQKKFFKKNFKKQPKKEERNANSSPTRPEESPRPGMTNRNRRNYRSAVHSIINALKRDDHPHLDVIINGHPTTLLLDTGAEIKIISTSNWKRLGQPTLQKTTKHITAANGTAMKINGYFDANFAVMDSTGGKSTGQGTCYVSNDNCNVFGMPWIKQLPELNRAVKKYQINSTIIVD